ncbi:MAG TPA: heme-binding protein [Candidatus Sulfotelmatobacter sp.]|nr:heme-binding protein [Candidatus Sulfotelmatobacter sp.]
MPSSSSLVVQTPSLSLRGCRLLIESALALAHERGLRITVAVTDPAGALLAFQRMDGAAPVTADVAIGKARTASLLRAPSKLFEDMINDGQTAMLSAPGLVPLQGGEPVLLEGQVCGAVGISGSAGETDQKLAADVAATFRT